MKGRRSALLGALVCAAVGVGIGALLRSGPSPFEAPRDAMPQIRAARRVFAAAASVSALDAEAMSLVLSRATPIPNQLGVYEPTPEMRDGLWSLVSDWVRLRATGNADEYIAWMRGRGYDWSLGRPERPRHYNMTDWDIRNAWKVYSGAEAPARIEDIDPEAFFRLSFDRSLALAGGMLRPARVSTHAEVVFQEIPVTRYDTRPGPLEGWSGMTLWSGRSVNGDRPHWTAPVTYGDVLRRDSVAFVATLFLGIQGANGVWVPTRVCAYYEIASGRWDIESVTYSNSRFEGIAVEW